MSIKIIFFFLIFCTIIGNSDAKTWRYVDPTNQAMDLIIEKNQNAQSISLGHQVYRATYCKDSEEFTCFSGGVLAFAIPKKDTATHFKNWSYAGRDYKLQKYDYIYMLGQKIQVYFVEAINVNGLSFVYLYSPTRGLVAVKLKAENSPLLILEISCGFGAGKLCR